MTRGWDQIGLRLLRTRSLLCPSGSNFGLSPRSGLHVLIPVPPGTGQLLLMPDCEALGGALCHSGAAGGEGLCSSRTEDSLRLSPSPHSEREEDRERDERSLSRVLGRDLAGHANLIRGTAVVDGLDP